MSKSGQWQWRPRDIGRGREKDCDGIVITEGWNKRGGYTDSRNGRQWTAMDCHKDRHGGCSNVRRIRRRIRRATMFGEQKAEDEERWDMGWQRFSRHYNVSASRMRTCGRRRIREKAWEMLEIAHIQRHWKEQTPGSTPPPPQSSISSLKRLWKPTRICRIDVSAANEAKDRITACGYGSKRRHLHLVCVLLAGWVPIPVSRRTRREQSWSGRLGTRRRYVRKGKTRLPMRRSSIFGHHWPKAINFPSFQSRLHL